MRGSNADIAVVAAAPVVYSVAAVLGAPAALIALLGLVLAACPGYVWSEVLLSPRVVGLERLAVAAGVSLGVPVIGGLVMYAAGIPLHRTAWAALFASTALLGDAVLVGLRRTGRRTPRGRPRNAPRLAMRHTVTFGAAVIIAAGAVGIALVGAARQQYPGFTQLWLLPGGQHGSTASLGVTNHQGTVTRYRLVLLRRARVSTSWNLSLADGQTWQRTVAVHATDPLAARLYRLPDLTRPYRYVTTAHRPGGQ
jgi:hypothetical protein